MELITPTGPVVVIDDERTHPGADLHLRTSAEALAWLEVSSGCRELWLDHDLGGEDTTRAVALHLAERHFTGNPFPVGVVYVHSMNPVGLAWLYSTLAGRYPVRVARFF